MDYPEPHAEDAFWLPLGDALDLLTRTLGDRDEAKRVFLTQAKSRELVCKSRRSFGHHGGHDLEGADRYVRPEIWRLIDNISDAQWRRGDVVTLDGRIGYLGVDVAKPSLDNALENLAPTKRGQGVSTGAAEGECGDWLRAQFLCDPDRKRAKASFWEAAQLFFQGRLSKRGFDRAWAPVAKADGRTVAGRKPRTESNR
jgi:hypothetical protein